MILAAAAVYTADAYEVNFGDRFRNLIRRPESWRSSDAFEILGNFRGRILLIVAEKDEKIPVEIPDAIKAAARNAESCEILTVAGAPHGMWQFLQSEPGGAAQLTRISDAIVREIRS